MLGYPIVVIPCGQHVQELIPKHLTRLLSGRATTGPGEVLFLKFYNAQNEVADFVQPDTVLHSSTRAEGWILSKGGDYR